jgi:hypothetical protein
MQYQIITRSDKSFRDLRTLQNSKTKQQNKIILKLNLKQKQFWKCLLSFTSKSSPSHFQIKCQIFFFSLALQPPWALSSAFSFMIIFTGAWTSDQLIARPLPEHSTTQTQNKHTHTNHPCPEWDSKSRSQRQSERRQFMP